MKLIKIYLILFSITIYPAPFLNKETGMSYLLVIVMFFSACSIINKQKFFKTELTLYVFLIFLWVFPLLSNSSSFRFSTVMFTTLYVVSYIAYMKSLNRGFFSLEKYIFFLRAVIIAYFCMLVIQQLCVLFDFPVLNANNYSPHNAWKLNALSAEPSHSARIIGVLMYSHLIMTELVNGKKFTLINYVMKDKLLMLSFLWSSLTMGSGTAFLMLALLILRLFHLKDIWLMILLIGIGGVVVSNLDMQAFERFTNFATAVMSLNNEKMILADHSASVRVVPFIIAADKLNIFSLSGIIGNGIDFTKSFMSIEFPGVKDDFTGGGLLSFALEFGWPLCLIFLYVTFKQMVINTEPLTFVFWFIFIAISGINEPLLWFSLFLLSTNKYFKRIVT
nr:Wzx [Plesiomonas shigelloides]